MEMDTYTDQELIREHVRLCPSLRVLALCCYMTGVSGGGDKEERPFEETIPENLSILMKSINPYI